VTAAGGLPAEVSVAVRSGDDAATGPAVDVAGIAAAAAVAWLVSALSAARHALVAPPVAVRLACRPAATAAYEASTGDTWVPRVPRAAVYTSRKSRSDENKARTPENKKTTSMMAATCTDRTRRKQDAGSVPRRADTEQARLSARTARAHIARTKKMSHTRSEHATPLGVHDGFLCLQCSRRHALHASSRLQHAAT
jgi:hypothetical protein